MFKFRKMKVPNEESKAQNNDNTINDDDNESNPYDADSNSDSVDQPTRDGDFSEYMWMENQEEFDLQVKYNKKNKYFIIFTDLFKNV